MSALMNAVSLFVLVYDENAIPSVTLAIVSETLPMKSPSSVLDVTIHCLIAPLHLITMSLLPIAVGLLLQNCHGDKSVDE